MSTPEQPDTPALTRRQMREIRSTGATPVVTPEAEAPVAEPEAPVAAPLPRAAEPAPVAPAPVADAEVELGVAPLTRRQAREQERIRTASVPVVTPDATPVVAPEPAPEVVEETPREARRAKKEKRKRERAEAAAAAAPEVIATVPGVVADPTVEEIDAEEEREDATPADAAEAPAAEVLEEGVVDAGVVEVSQESEKETSEVDDRVALDETPATDEEAAVEEVAADDTADADEDEAPSALLNPALGSGLLAGETPAVTLPPSFDQLITRAPAATGSISTPNALILSQTPSAAPLVAPVTATGEVLITGTFELPEGLGSVGHLPGAADGKDLDVALIDGELPAASSPTPIAASAAISTVRNSGEEIIRPPAPEKGGRLMLTLVITAGVLALALAGVLILAITTGVF